ncbi:hypothetical protein MJD09_05685 [bacterium]|nr:hypothetical protein [bacterium]
MPCQKTGRPSGHPSELGICVHFADFSSPTLLIHGEAEAIPMDLMEEWLTVLTNARLLRVPDAGNT